MPLTICLRLSCGCGGSQRHVGSIHSETMQRDESPVPHFAAADLHLIQRTVDHVRRRLRIQAAVRGLSHGLVAAATVMLLALVLFRLDVLSRKWLLSVAWLAPIGVLLTTFDGCGEFHIFVFA